MLALTAVASTSILAPALAAVPLYDGPKGKLDAEIRLMFWGVLDGRDSVPAGSTAQNEHVNDFLLRRGRIVLRGQASEKLSIYAQFGQDNVGGKVLAEDAGIRVKDLSMNYRFAEAFQGTAGQFKVPFLRQNLESGFNQLFVDRAATPSLRPAKEGSRDLGLMAWGNAGGLQYRAAIFDGADQETKNPNSSTRGAARVSYNWFTNETTPGYTGTWIGEKKVLQVGVQIDAQNGRLDPKDDAAFVLQSRDYRARAIDVFYDQPLESRWALTFEGSWLDRRDNYRAAGLDTRLLSGYYAQAGVLLPWEIGAGRLQAEIRYEALDADRGPASGSSVNRSVGVTYFAKGHDRKIQLDYTKKTESPTGLDNDELRLSLVTVF